MDETKIKIYHPDEKICAQIRELVPFEVVNDSIANATESTIVSAGNCFGTMDGGSDLALINKFPMLQENVMYYINGINPIGNPQLIMIPHCMQTLIHLPTMPTPRVKVHIEVIKICYLNLFLRLKYMTHHLRVKTTDVAMPMLGTGYGGHSYEESCRVLNDAWEMAKNI